MAITASTVLGGLTAGGMAASYKQASRAQDNAEKAQANALKQAEATAAAATEANNKANQKKPNSSALLTSNQMAGKGGQAGTMLTGSGGLNPSTLALGKTTLLGGA